MSLRQTLAAAVVLAFVLHLSGCDRTNPEATPTAEDALVMTGPPNSGDRPADAPGAPAPTPTSTPPAPSQSAEAPAGEPLPVQPSPDHVLRDWGAAIERRDWAAVHALWGHGGADSGLSATAFAARWDRLRRPRVMIGSGEQEGAAGSLFYTAPVTITDGGRIIAGNVTLRRVNDVPGATAGQLRWHLDPTTREPWTNP